MMDTTVRVIGLDWATEDSRRGVAAVDVNNAATTLVLLEKCGKRSLAVDVVGKLLEGTEHSLIAIDAPLGWPVAMGAELAKHEAGNCVGVPPTEMFSRATDRFVRDRLKFRPMEVGANLIARVAH